MPKCAAPMPKKEEDILNNSMKLFAYLSTLSGLANYPSNTRMFRQKNLMPSRIKKQLELPKKQQNYIYIILKRMVF